MSKAKMSKKEKQAEIDRQIIKMNSKEDVMWKLLEDEYLEEIISIKRDAEELTKRIKNNEVSDTTAREVAILLMASLTHGEILKRRIERQRMDDFMMTKKK